MSKNALSEVEEVEDAIKTVDEGVIEKEITWIDPKWADFILSFLDDSEVPNGYPTTPGLRRFLEEHIGIIISSNNDVKYNGDAVCITHSIIVGVYKDCPYIPNLKSAPPHFELHSCGTVDGKRGLMNEPYHKHLGATVDTKAEGKAIRRLLRYSGITAEEASREDTATSDIENDELEITDSQLMAIDQLFKRMNINASKFFKVTGYEWKTASLADGEQILDRLTEYQRDKDSIEQEIKGYNEDMYWRT